MNPSPSCVERFSRAHTWRPGQRWEDLGEMHVPVCHSLSVGGLQDTKSTQEWPACLHTPMRK